MKSLFFFLVFFLSFVYIRKQLCVGGGLHYIIFSKQTTCCLLKNLQDVGQDGFQGDCMHSITVRTKDGDVLNGTKGRASFGWDLRAPRFYAIVLLAGKVLHTPLINGFCKAFVKVGKLQALQDCCPGLEATTQPGSEAL